ncbi:MAG: RteC domain-containing protein, partial [Ginsengibacter sp.]
LHKLNSTISDCLKVNAPPMQLEKFSISLYEEMENKIEGVNQKQGNSLQKYREIAEIILGCVARLKAFIIEFTFSDKDQEIKFFKTIKPKFLSKLIFHQKVFTIQSHLPPSTMGDIREYYYNELKKLKDFFKTNDELLTYYKSQATSYDEIYFLRKEPESWLLLTMEGYETDVNFTTVYDYKISRLIAYEALGEFITSAIDELEMKPGVSFSRQITSKQNVVNWTASKVALVELLYALQSAGACNNGNIDLKQMASHFEKIFNIDLGNYYRVFQEMRIRKLNRTTFLDQLKDRLVQRMDESDENPKFK